MFDLYAKGLPLGDVDLETVATRTEGVTASFFRELLRQTALESAERGSETVNDDDLRRALDRLLEHAGTTRILLGAERPDPERLQDDPRAWMMTQRLTFDE